MKNWENIWLLDVDGVVAEVVDPLFEIVKPKITRGDIHQFNFFELMNQQEKELAFGVMNAASYWENLPLVPGALDGVEAIRKAGFRVIWNTSPWDGCSEWGYIRREWLKHNFGSEKKDVSVAADKSLIRAAAFFDDRTSNLTDWTEAHEVAGCRGYAFDQPWNQDFQGLRVSGWDDIDRVIEEVLNNR